MCGTVNSFKSFAINHDNADDKYNKVKYVKWYDTLAILPFTSLTAYMIMIKIIIIKDTTIF